MQTRGYAAQAADNRLLRMNQPNKTKVRPTPTAVTLPAKRSSFKTYSTNQESCCNPFMRECRNQV